MPDSKDRPKLTNYVMVRFSTQYDRVVFYTKGHGSYGVKPSEKTQRLWELLEEVYEDTVSLTVEL